MTWNCVTLPFLLWDVSSIFPRLGQVVLVCSVCGSRWFSSAVYSGKPLLWRFFFFLRPIKLVQLFEVLAELQMLFVCDLSIIMPCLRANDGLQMIVWQQMFLSAWVFSLRGVTQSSGFHSRLNNARGAPAHDIIWSTFRMTGAERKVSTLCGLTHMQEHSSSFLITY